MQTQLILQGLALSVGLYWVGWVFYAKWLHPLARFPGPPLAAISRLWIVMHVARGHAESEQRRLHMRYGPVIRIAPNELAVSDPAAIKRIYGIKSGFTKTDFYLPFRSPFARYPDHFTATDEKSHASRRKIVNHIYSMTSILQAEKYVDLCTEVLLKRFGEMADQQAAVDLFQWARMYAYDVIGEFYFEKMFGFLESQRDHLGYLSSTDALIPVMTLSAVMPKYVRPLFMLCGLLSSRMRASLGAFRSLTTATDAAVEDRLESKEVDVVSQRPDVLTKVFTIYQKEGQRVDFDIDDVKLEAYGAFFAGSDTTAIALTGILYHVLRSDSVLEALRREVDRATQDGELGVPYISYDEAVKLPYLNACVKEGMRIHPSVGLTLPRNVPDPGCEVAGYWIPGKTRIGVNPAVVHLDRSVFGEDALTYRPERWLSPGAHEMIQYIIQFGAGSRTCMGKHISLCEIFKVIPELVRSFDLDLECPDGDLETTAYWFYKPTEVKIRVRRRKTGKVE
ncbi:cytochrome P450 monooxygenase [Aspergillus steynii IBT 23096]|uniref:Cytochrome P450 monooxygenase n=1 Tax=Aspergillus steynii IBT 23096 TaxID=1392250 RepID=A0A2I2FS67_9EURO|nr:cytochrome P450 monooxygenase [Aspergillus steynii IBT 23096]PLB43463.1 cytochrome P450 monooxygenase [Aspergillus steynii IBT 23096]